jgi:aminodeoxyfutalosine deaminase
MRKLSADYLFTEEGLFEKDKVLLVSDTGEILAIEPKNLWDASELEYFKGALLPGMINTHCHLELSHLKGCIATGTGLIPFITQIVQLRDFPKEQILEAIAKADADMFANGIQAVGDISNQVDSFATKERSSMQYYSFVELFDFLQGHKAVEFAAPYWEVYQKAPSSKGNRKSLVPHAPYSVSQELHRWIVEANKGEKRTISLHNQETAAEIEFFEKGTGAFLGFFKDFGFSMDLDKGKGQSSLMYALGNMDPTHRTLLVHNTMTQAEDVQNALAWGSEIYWASCPNANLYIENRLPNYKELLSAGAVMTLGTDSLASNWQLSIWSEIQTILKYNSHLSLEEVLQWGTLHGAKALGMDHALGSLKVGKKPGILHLSLDEMGQLSGHSQLCRVI